MSRWGPWQERYWQYVEKSPECWLWLGRCSGSGYGVMKFDKKQYYAHRLSFVLRGIDIPDNICVLHHCDNPSCVNPDHLFLGTQGDNNRDRMIKGRGANGEKNSKAKFTDDEVLRIRANYTGRRGEQAELVRKYGVASSTISFIVRNRFWKHLLVDKSNALS